MKTVKVKDLPPALKKLAGLSLAPDGGNVMDCKCQEWFKPGSFPLGEHHPDCPNRDQYRPVAGGGAVCLVWEHDQRWVVIYVRPDGDEGTTRAGNTPERAMFFFAMSEEVPAAARKVAEDWGDDLYLAEIDPEVQDYLDGHP